MAASGAVTGQGIINGMSRWTEYEAFLRDRAYQTLDRDPRILMEGDGGPVGLDADLFHARLLGFEDEVVRDIWVRGAEPTLLMPIEQSFATMAREATDQAFLDAAGIYDPDLGFRTSRVARYELQSGYVVLSVAAEYQPPVERLRPDSTARVAYLRYRRRS